MGYTADQDVCTIYDVPTAQHDISISQAHDDVSTFTAHLVDVPLAAPVPAHVNDQKEGESKCIRPAQVDKGIIAEIKVPLIEAQFEVPVVLAHPDEFDAPVIPARGEVLTQIDGECNVLYTNMDSFLNKISEFFTLIAHRKPSIIALTEILSKNQVDFNPVEYEIPGYNMFVNVNPRRGVAIYTAKHLNANEFHCERNGFTESVWCYFNDKYKNSVLIGCLYRSPNSTDENTQEMYTMLKNENIHAFNKICILGDFNFPAIKWQGGWTGDKDNELIECFRDAFLMQMVSKPTRTRVGQTCNILDLVIINDVSLISDIEHGSPIGKSDHETLFFTLYVEIVQSTDINDEYVYDLSKGDYKKMRMNLRDLDWNVMLNGDVDQCWNVIKGELQEAMRVCIPKVKKRINTNMTPRWMTNKIKRVVKKKYNLYKKYLNTRLECDQTNYVNVINECNKSIRCAKRKHEKILSNESKSNPRNFWKYVNSNSKNTSGISSLQDGMGQLSVTDKEKANTLNTFFSSVFTQENLNNLPHTETGDASDGITVADIRVTPDVIYDKLCKLNKRKAQGPDSIPPRVLIELSK